MVDVIEIVDAFWDFVFVGVFSVGVGDSTRRSSDMGGTTARVSLGISYAVFRV